MKNNLKNKFTEIIYTTVVAVALSFVSLSVIGYGGASAATDVTTEKAASCGSNISLTYSADCDEKEKAKKVCPASNPNCKPSSQVEELIKTIINVISALVGAIAVIMVLIGGFKFVTAGGNSDSVSSAKNTIIYAIVGLIIVAFAQVIVRFVLQRI